MHTHFGVNLPVQIRNIDNTVNHLTSKFIRLNIDRRSISRNIDLTKYIEQERFLNSARLRWMDIENIKREIS